MSEIPQKREKETIKMIKTPKQVYNKFCPKIVLKAVNLFINFVLLHCYM